MYSFDFDTPYDRQALLLCALVQLTDAQLGQKLSTTGSEQHVNPEMVYVTDSALDACETLDASLFAQGDDKQRFVHDLKSQNTYAHMLEHALVSGESFTTETAFKQLHASLFAGHEHAGAYATFANKIRVQTDNGLRVAYIAAPPEIKSQEIRAMFDAYNRLIQQNPKLHIAYACCMLLNCYLIHPFQDGNGRTARFVFMSELYRGGLNHITDVALCKHFASNLLMPYISGKGWPTQYGQPCNMAELSIPVLKALAQTYKLALE